VEATALPPEPPPAALGRDTLEHYAASERLTEPQVLVPLPPAAENFYQPEGVEDLTPDMVEARQRLMKALVAVEVESWSIRRAQLEALHPVYWEAQLDPAQVAAIERQHEARLNAAQMLYHEHHERLVGSGGTRAERAGRQELPQDSGEREALARAEAQAFRVGEKDAHGAPPAGSAEQRARDEARNARQQASSRNSRKPK
jgi:hypothetical protein